MKVQIRPRGPSSVRLKFIPGIVVPFASQAEAESGAVGGKAMSPFLTKKAIDAQVPSLVTEGIGAQVPGLVAQGVPTAPVTPTGATAARPLKDRLADAVHVLDFVPVNLHAGLLAGTNTTDVTAYLQAAANEAGKAGKALCIQGPGPYLISSKIQFITRRTTDARPTDRVLHFTDFSPFYVRGYGSPEIQAMVAMDCMFEFVFDGAGNLGPFSSKVEGIFFNGNKLAVTGIWSNWTMHMRYQDNRFYGLERGLWHTGYGGFKAMGNKFQCKHGIYFLAGGGDSIVEGNDFYVLQNDSAPIYMGYWGGNTVIQNNTFTNEGGGGSTFTNVYAIQMDGATAPAAQEIRHVTIKGNEFCGFTSGIRARGKAYNTRNIWQVTVTMNHVTQYGSIGYGQLIDAQYCDDWDIFDNFINTYYLAGGTRHGIEIDSCIRFRIHDNEFQKHNGHSLKITDCQSTDIYDNEFHLWGLTDATLAAVGIYRSAVAGQTSWKNLIKFNVFRQDGTNSNRPGVAEYNVTNSDVTYAYDNEFDNVLQAYVKVSSQSVMRRVYHSSSLPTTGTHNVGDQMINTVPDPAQPLRACMGWTCVAAGTPGTWMRWGPLDLGNIGFADAPA